MAAFCSQCDERRKQQQQQFESSLNVRQQPFRTHNANSNAHTAPTIALSAATTIAYFRVSANIANRRANCARDDAQLAKFALAVFLRNGHYDAKRANQQQQVQFVARSAQNAHRSRSLMQRRSRLFFYSCFSLHFQMRGITHQCDEAFSFLPFFLSFALRPDMIVYQKYKVNFALFLLQSAYDVFCIVHPRRYFLYFV